MTTRRTAAGLPTLVWPLLPKDLCAAWLAVSALYWSGLRSLPEPWLALVVSTAVAVLATVTKAGLAQSRATPILSRASGGDRVPQSRTGPARPQEPAVRAGQWHPEPSAPAAPPSSVPTSPVRTVPARMEPAQQPPVVENASVAATLNLARYAVADSREMQCPRCGRFDVTTENTGIGAFGRCSVCGEEWPLDEAPPDVFIRSWLSTR